jgi:TRAP-type mannitol/chloroaromatic compound transport system permease small subunit
MRSLLVVSEAIDALNRWIGRATIGCILASVLIGTGNAVMRKAFRLTSNVWSELQWYLFAAAFLLAMGYVLMVDEHVRVDVLARRLSARARAWLDLLALLLFVLPLCALMVALGGAYFWRAFASGEGSYMADGLLIWPVRLFIPLGFALLGLQSISETVKRWVYLRGVRSRATTTEADLPGFFGTPDDEGARS